MLHHLGPVGQPGEAVVMGLVHECRRGGLAFGDVLAGPHHVQRSASIVDVHLAHA